MNWKLCEHQSGLRLLNSIYFRGILRNPLRLVGFSIFAESSWWLAGYV